MTSTSSTSSSLRRLMKEASELSSSPSPYFHAHPISDSNLYDWHFTLAGPPSPSPYAHGIYHGRIVLPPSYPLRPPSFRFLTPSGRFEVNREICLSISGHHEETWQPAWGIRTALLALRSFMDAEAKGQVGGLDVPEEVRRELAGRSRGWVCEGCARGKSNEEVLGEWRRLCEEMGVVVEEGEQVGGGDDGEVAAPETVSSGGLKPNASPNAATAQTPASIATTEDESLSSPRAAPAASSSPSPGSAAAAAAAAASSPQPPSSNQTSRAEPTSTPTSTTPASASAPAPTPTVPLRVPVSTAQSQSQFSDGPWLDRAILGVFIALIVAILRRMARTDDI